MVSLLRNLEPRIEQADTTLFSELDEVNEVLFFTNGIYKIGFEINHTKTYPLRFKNSNIIGSYGATFHEKSEFIYKTVTIC